MRSILEKAIVSLLNENNDQAEALFHKFMVERARQIHESLRQGEEVVLAEGWDDEISSEEYFSDDDLDGVEDATDDVGDAATDVADASGDLADASADLGDDLGDGGGEDASADLGDDLGAGDDLGGEGEEGGNGEVVDRLDDIESHIEELTAKFEEMMAELDGGEGEDIDGLAGVGDVDAGEGDVPDFGGDGEGDEPDGDEELPEPAEDEGDEPPVDDDDDDEVTEGDEGGNTDDDDLEDITESVMAELEKISVTMPDGKESGTGKSVTQNNKSILPNNPPDKRQAGEPVVIKSTNHTGYERETPPTSKDTGAGMPKSRTNVKAKANQFQSTVPAGGDKGALLHKDFAGGTKDTKSPVIQVKK